MKTLFSSESKGTLVGNYTVLYSQLLGKGTTGTVYRGTTRIIKVIITRLTLQLLSRWSISQPSRTMPLVPFLRIKKWGCRQSAMPMLWSYLTFLIEMDHALSSRNCVRVRHWKKWYRAKESFLRQTLWQFSERCWLDVWPSLNNAWSIVT